MKKITSVGISFLLVAMLGACSKEQPGSNIDTNTVSQGAQEEIMEKDEELDEAPTLPEMIPPVADAAMYRGVVTDIDESEDGVVITLAQVEGTNFGSTTLSVSVTSNTSTNVHLNEIAEDKYVEVYYGVTFGAEMPETVDAIMINLLADADLTIFNGVVEAYTPDVENPGTGSFLLQDDNGYEILFHFNEETQLYLNEIKEGDKLNVYFSGATTRSIPPQATAMEVRPFAEA